MASGWMQASVPPATMTSASPYWIKRDASPIEWAPVVHAVEAAWFGPYLGACVNVCVTVMGASFSDGGEYTLKPYFIVRWPAAMLIRIRGTNIGDTLRYP